jgi:hypothetical protein
LIEFQRTGWARFGFTQPEVLNHHYWAVFRAMAKAAIPVSMTGLAAATKLKMINPTSM